MKSNEIVRAGIIGGVLIIVLEFLVGIASPAIVYNFSFIAMLVGGFASGWIIKGEMGDALIAGGLAGLTYIILGLFILFPLVSSYHSTYPVIALIIGIVLGAIGAFVGNYLANGNGESKKSSGMKR